MLDLPVAHAPGTKASYCTGGVVVLGAIVERASKMTFPELATKALFEPLDVLAAEWQSIPSGGTDTGGHLHLRPRDFAKLGQLFLDRGVWRDRRIVPEAWVAESVAPHTTLGDSSYGYLWWVNTFRVRGTPVDTYFARGNGGQYVFVAPSLGLVAAFNGSDYGGPGSVQPIEMFGKHVLAAAVP